MRSKLHWIVAAGLVTAAYTVGVVGIPSEDQNPLACGEDAKKKKQDKKDDKRS